jgi:HSP20 family protein
MANLVRRDNWDPFRVVESLLGLDPFRGTFPPVPRGSEFAPRFDVKETKEAYVITADLPGVKDADVDISLHGNVLTITGKREGERRDEAEKYYAVERNYGSFARSFGLPDSVDSEHVAADLKHGVLTVNVPKRPEAQPRKIAIGNGEGQNKAKA